MPSIETIYKEAILPLPPDEKLRLAELIIEHVREESIPPGRTSAYDVLKKMRPHRLFKDSAAADEHIRAERDCWDD